MATQREIRRRMGSIRNIRQITRAMELIAVTRLRRAQQRVLASRPYADKMRQVLGDLVEQVEQVEPGGAPGAGEPAVAGPPDVNRQANREADHPPAEAEGAEVTALHPLLDRRPVRRVGVLLLTTDRGLCGALNSNTIRTALQYAYGQQNQGRAVEFVVVGRKGLQATSRLPVTVTAEFTALGDYPSLTRIAPIVRVVMDAFTSQALDEVVLVYPRFVSTLRQDPSVVPLLPIQPPEEAEEETRGARAGEVDYIYEPDPRSVLAELLPRFVEVQVYQAVLEMIASEFSARMVAMRNATDNAGELLDDLQLGFNKARQATITREIIEVSAGANTQQR
ncbi:MAG: ATP synthase F1 subunit gamma [Chloroflexota bacterium]